MVNIEEGKEPTEKEIQRAMAASPGKSYYEVREELRNSAYGSKPPSGYQSWGDYWKSY